MRDLLILLKRFQSDERGAFLVLFGVLALVLIATSGAVVDFTTVEQSRTRAQDALDSAALGLQPTIYDTPTPTAAALKTEAENLLIERLADARVTATVDDVIINTTDGTLRLEASLTVPTAFVSLVGVNQIRASLVSEATRRRLNVEVAMVLDNSGSMAWFSRMDELKQAAASATEILFSGAATQPNVFVGIVPFTEFVNVGTANETASWMDQTGVSDIANDNFDDDDDDSTPFAGPVSRFDLFDQLANVDWKGCVEARKTPYDTDDTVPDIASPDTLFVPTFAPDEPGSGGFPNNYLSDTPLACTNQEPRYVWTQTRYSCDKNANNSQSNYNTAVCDGAPTTDLYQTVSELGVVTAATSTPPSSLFNNPYPGAGNYSASYATISGSGSNRTNRRILTWTYRFSQRELQERLCKYTGNVNTSRDGPNVDCPDNAVMPLTNVKATVLAKITAMDADGGTNIHQGTIWGFHMLSPTEPLPEAKEYDSATYKVMIVMTDGENTHSHSGNMNGADWYVAYGYPWNSPLAKRLSSVTYPNPSSTSQLQLVMNERTTTTCTNAKNAGITIYTIGLSSPNATTTAMLTECATSPSYAYFPTDPTELDAIFSEIATQLSNLRLAQ